MTDSLSREWQCDRVLRAILALTFLLGLFYNGAILLGRGPDEQRHMNYVTLLLDQHQLPRILTTNPYSETGGAHAFHPPLYYLVLLPFYALLRGLPGELVWHALRLVSLALCLIPLPMIYQIARRVGSQWFARLVVAQIALLPMWGMTAATINNDSATFCAVTVFLWMLLVKFEGNLDCRACLWLGLVMGIGGLCKATALLCDGVALLLFFAARDGKTALKSKATWQSALTVLLLGAIIVSPWHIRSMMLYGTWTPLPEAAPTPTLPPPEAGKLVQMMHPNFPFMFLIANWRLFYTLWRQSEWFLQRLPEGTAASSGAYTLQSPQLVIYSVLVLYTLAAIFGAVRGWRRDRESAIRPILWPCYAAFALTWLIVLQVALLMHWGWSEGGRYLLPAFVGFSLFLAHGWRGLAGEKILPALTGLWIVAGIGLNCLSLWWLLNYLNPTFGPK